MYPYSSPQSGAGGAGMRQRPRPPPHWGGDGAGLVAAGERGAILSGPRKIFDLTQAISKYCVEYEVRCVAAGDQHRAVVLMNGTVLTYGSNDAGQLGRVSLTPAEADGPAEIPGLTNAIGVACGRRSTIVVTEEGKAIAFGENLHGELGIGGDADAPPRATLLRTLGTHVQCDEHIIAVACGSNHTLFLLEGGRIAISGLFIGPPNRVPVILEGIGGIVSIAAGDTHNAVVSEDGRVATWGENDYGQLGQEESSDDDEADDVDNPTFLLGITDAVSVACGDFMTAIVHQNGDVSVCGGRESRDEEPSRFLGLGEAVSRVMRPRKIPSLSNIVAISVSTGDQESCFVVALKLTGNVFVFGNGSFLLNDLGQHISTPEIIAGFNTFTS
jgi:alpha-tubulin suppressor-like RCC1 family protein